jgi:hypothetical protein
VISFVGSWLPDLFSSLATILLQRIYSAEKVRGAQAASPPLPAAISRAKFDFKKLVSASCRNQQAGSLSYPNPKNCWRATGRIGCVLSCPRINPSLNRIPGGNEL